MKLQASSLKYEKTGVKPSAVNIPIITKTDIAEYVVLMQVREPVSSNSDVNVSHLLVVDTRRGKYVITYAGFSSKQRSAVAEYVRYENKSESSGSSREGL